MIASVRWVVFYYALVVTAGLRDAPSSAHAMPTPAATTAAATEPELGASAAGPSGPG